MNFASYFSPGGGFIQGAIAQEEALCHESFLYNVLKEQTEFYEKNNRDFNSYLFYNRGMYSKHVLFFRDKVQSFDVITCAAPDYRRAKEFVSNAENSIALLNRIAFIRYLAEMHQYYERGYTPKVKATKSCNACSLKDLCLPRLMKTRKVSEYIKNALREEVEECGDKKDAEDIVVEISE